MHCSASAAGTALRVLVLTRSYPAAGDLYQYPFVHRRVLAYRSAGREVAVFRLTAGAAGHHKFEGVTCHSGDPAEFRAFAKVWKPDVIAAHGFSEAMWSALNGIDAIPVRAWLHGSEIPAFFRSRAMEIREKAARASALGEVEARAAFWRELLKAHPNPPRLVFVSHAAVEMMREEGGERLTDGDFEVVPNPIDTDLFTYVPKLPEQRFSFLSIRPYECPTRANDLAVAAVLQLSNRPGFDRLRFTFIGDGPLFEETLRPIADLPNITVRRGFLTQQEIVREHSRHGIFLVPTRLDTQGVSRDEAMASGLVPVTNAIPVVREFVDEDCAGLAAPDDHVRIADEIWRMVEDSNLFERRSRTAADRVRRERGHERVIPAELDLLAAAANG